MYNGGDKDLSDAFSRGAENSKIKLSQKICDPNFKYTDEKNGFPKKSIDFLIESETVRDVRVSKPLEIRDSASQELALSYRCDNPKFGMPEKDATGNNLLNSLEKINCKGKEIVSESFAPEDSWVVERDFLSLNEGRGGCSKREIEQEMERENLDKKPKLETLNLSLALPAAYLSLNGEDPPSPLNPNISSQMLLVSNNNTQTTCSNDFTAASLSYSYSHPFSHNPSCSLTRNSTENYEYSVGRNCDQLWHCGEGTNGSVHSRLKPIGDGSLGFALMQGGRAFNRDLCNNNYTNNSLHMTTSSENISFYPSELPARPIVDTESGGGDSRGKDLESEQHMNDFVKLDGWRLGNPSTPERILHEIVSGSIPVMAHKIQELPEETMELMKEHLRNIIAERREELGSLQNRLGRRSDLTIEPLSKAQKDQLDILVAIKTGLSDFMSEKNQLPSMELTEIFLSMRCRNMNCKSLLPVDDCDCKICSGNKGFCRECMCPVCLSFDCASNTCSWVGCDVCSHWCHAACGIRKNLIKPGPSLKGPSRIFEMQFHCSGCGHASEMFGFVKDVFVCCAKDWGVDIMVKELDCVRRIFVGSQDFKGKELHNKATETLTKLERKIMSPSDACNSITHFFKAMDGMTDLPSSNEKQLQPLSTTLPRIYTSYNNMDSIEDEFLAKKDGYESLESFVRIKELEARVFQSRADEARREAENYGRMVKISSEKMEEEYGAKLAKLCLQETEERRRKKMEELKVLENSRFDYCNMKMRMQAEISGLLERMEATKKQLI